MHIVAGDIALVALGGAIGAVGRYSLGLMQVFAAQKHLATLTANISGCLAIGVVWALLQHYGAPRAWQLLLITGVLGGYTTFSAFALDGVALWQQSEGAALPWRALAYVATTVLAGIAACAIGLYATNKLIQTIN